MSGKASYSHVSVLSSHGSPLQNTSSSPGVPVIANDRTMANGSRIMARWAKNAVSIMISVIVYDRKKARRRRNMARKTKVVASIMIW